jgi:hypothetical protein
MTPADDLDNVCWARALQKLATGPRERLTDGEARALKEHGAAALMQQHAGGKRYAQRRHNEPVQRRRPS